MDQQIQKWRKQKRAELIQERMALSKEHRREFNKRIMSILHQALEALSRSKDQSFSSIAFYWPIRGEVDLRRLIQEWIDQGYRSCLPVVVEKNAPVEFYEWKPGWKMKPGAWSIPEPVNAPKLSPELVLAPLVGFDDQGYRLGNGGGYYDRTLAALDPKPITIGIGYELTRLPTIHPQPHDVPMDAILTEKGCEWKRVPEHPLSF